MYLCVCLCVCMFVLGWLKAHPESRQMMFAKANGKIRLCDTYTYAQCYIMYGKSIELLAQSTTHNRPPARASDCLFHHIFGVCACECVMWSSFCYETTYRNGMKWNGRKGNRMDWIGGKHICAQAKRFQHCNEINRSRLRGLQLQIKCPLPRTRKTFDLMWHFKWSGRMNFVAANEWMNECESRKHIFGLIFDYKLRLLPPLNTQWQRERERWRGSFEHDNRYIYLKIPLIG